MSTVKIRMLCAPELEFEVCGHTVDGYAVIDGEEACKLAETWAAIREPGVRPEGPRGWTVGERDADPIMLAYVDPRDPGHITFCEWQTAYADNDPVYRGDSNHWIVAEFPFVAEFEET